MEQLPISVIIAAKNAQATIGAQLDSLMRQQAAPPFEVIVADNGSTDETVRVCRAFDDRLNLHIVDASEEAGVSFARNTGATFATGHHLLFCDADDVLGPLWVSAMSDALASSNALATSTVELAELNTPVTREAFTGSPDQTTVAPYEVEGYLPFAIGCSIGVSRRHFFELGGFDMSLGGDEDTDFSWRAQEAGLKLVCPPAAVTHYRLRENRRQLYRQRKNYARWRVLTWVRSQALGRPVRGMSAKWSLTRVLLLPTAWLRSFGSPVKKLTFARDAGAVIGNLEGQFTFRLRRRCPEPRLMRCG